MSRPKAPYQYATTVNFPAGSNPWNGQPLKLLPLSDYVTPGVAIPAEELNYALNAATTYNQSLLNLLGQTAAQNWPVAPFRINATMATSAVCWDSRFSRWLAATYVNPNTAAVYASGDGGKTWATLGGASLPGSPIGAPFAMAAHPTTGDIVVVGPAGYVAKYTASSGTWAATSSTALDGTAGELRYLPLASTWVFAGGNWNGSVMQTRAGTSADGVTWTDRASALPSGFAGATNTDYLADVNPTTGTMLVTVRGLQTRYTTTTDGVTWTNSDFTGTPAVLDTVTPTGVAYSATENRWIMVGVTAGGGLSEVFTSTSDGAHNTWSHVANLGDTTAIIGGLAVMGTLWFAVTDDSGKNYNAQRGIYSTDSGATWRYASFYLPVSTVGNMKNRAFSNGQQFLASNGTYTMPSATWGVGGGAV